LWNATVGVFLASSDLDFRDLDNGHFGILYVL